MSREITRKIALKIIFAINGNANKQHVVFATSFQMRIFCFESRSHFQVLRPPTNFARPFTNVSFTDRLLRNFSPRDSLGHPLDLNGLSQRYRVKNRQPVWRSADHVIARGLLARNAYLKSGRGLLSNRGGLHDLVDKFQLLEPELTPSIRGPCHTFNISKN